MISLRKPGLNKYFLLNIVSERIFFRSRTVPGQQ